MLSIHIRTTPSRAEHWARTGLFTVRPLEVADIPQSAEIEREAFPTLFPSTHFRRELKNQRAVYLVACSRDEAVRQVSQPSSAPSSVQSRSSRRVVGALTRNARTIWRGLSSPLGQGQDLVVGFVGAWYLLDEAHIVSIGVRAAYRGQGIGELLLLAAIEEARARASSMVTLEVRRSNEIAKRLYRKYGFRERGVRKAYYADNREDALIMTTDRIQEPAFAGRLNELKRRLQQRWDRAARYFP